ncbi:hypothetical protein IMZ48_42980 [Candidatus Bathyarchaeota archaeon]|nr:hypothetical protein [Candidatus Bathyarchaeota archaeon]
MIYERRLFFFSYRSVTGGDRRRAGDQDFMRGWASWLILQSQKEAVAGDAWGEKRLMGILKRGCCRVRDLL